MKRLLLATAMCVFAASAHADARTEDFLRGIATEIANQCPNLPLDPEAKHWKSKTEFNRGKAWATINLADKNYGCEHICGFRPRTCDYIGEQKE